MRWGLLIGTLALAGTQPAAPPKADAWLWHRAAQGAAGGPVFVRATDAAGRRALRALGLDADRDGWQGAHLGAGALQTALAAGPGLLLRAASAHRPLSRESRAAVAAATLPPPRAAVGPAAGDGGGVLVGLVDTGIDLAHPAFRDARGRSRVVAVWDQDRHDGPAPVPFGYGHECTAQRIAAGTCPLGDPHGHGTHVAGIAAGGAPADGLAPAADIAVVCSADFTQLADAVSYLAQLADARDQPLVVNISVGGQYGPHDGRTPLEVTLDDLVRPGRVLVAAAGNDGADRIHLATALRPDGARVELRGLPVGSATQALVEVWADAAADVRLAVELWVQGRQVASAAMDAPLGSPVHARLGAAGATYVLLTGSHEPGGGEHTQVRRAIVFDRSHAAYLPHGGALVLRLAGAGEVQAWISQSDYSTGSSRFGDAAAPGWLAGDGARSIAVPATALQVIAVGSYVIRSSWEAQDGSTQLLPGLQVGALSPFSSVGPTGRPSTTGIKPDLCAPGSVIASARAAVVPPGPDVLDATTMMMQGTSMAAPHVTGAVALALAADASLDAAAVRALLRGTARADAFTGALPNDTWGHGKLDVGATMAAVAAGSSGCQGVAAAPWQALAILAVWRRDCRYRRKKRANSIA